MSNSNKKIYAVVVFAIVAMVIWLPSMAATAIDQDSRAVALREQGKNEDTKELVKDSYWYENYYNLQLTSVLYNRLLEDYEALFEDRVFKRTSKLLYSADGTVVMDEGGAKTVLIDQNEVGIFRGSYEHIMKTLSAYQQLLHKYDDIYLEEVRPGFKEHFFEIDGKRMSSINTALVIVDVWKYPPYDKILSDWSRLGYEPHTAKNIIPLIEFAREKNLLVVNAWHNSLKRHVHPMVEPKMGDLRISSAYINNDFAAVLTMLEKHGIENLIYTGYGMDACIITRPIGMRDMSKKGFSNFLIREATLVAPPRGNSASGVKAVTVENITQLYLHKTATEKRITKEGMGNVISFEEFQNSFGAPSD